MTNEIKNKILKSEPVAWKQFKFLQSGKLKHFPADLGDKLRESMIKNHFAEAFKVWQHGKDLYCLDGFHRCLILKELESQGYKIPQLLTGEFINCRNRQEAARLILVYSSQYTTINRSALADFMNENSVSADDMSREINLLFTTGGLERKESIDIQEEELKPYTKTHVLLSFDPNIWPQIEKYLSSIQKVAGVEYETSSNG